MTGRPSDAEIGQRIRDALADEHPDLTLDQIIKLAYTLDDGITAPDRFDEIQARVIAAEQRAQQRAQRRWAWSRYLAGNYWYGYPPPHRGRTRAALGTVVLFVVLLGLIVAVAVGVTGRG